MINKNKKNYHGCHREKEQILQGSLAQRYDRLHAISTETCIYASSKPRIGQAESVILDYIKPFHGKLIDIGCGRGGLILNAPKSYKVRVGVDFSHVFIKDAIRFKETFALEGNAEIEFLIHDLNNPLPYDSETFDVAVSAACIEHVFDVYGVFREVNRVLKPDGIFVFQLPNIAYIKHRIRLLFGFQPVTASRMDFWWRDYWDGTHLHYFTFGAIKMLLNQTGFQYKSATGSGKFRSLRAWHPSLLTGDLIVTARKKEI